MEDNSATYKMARPSVVARFLPLGLWAAVLLVLVHVLCTGLVPKNQWIGPILTGCQAFLCCVLAILELRQGAPACRRAWGIVAGLFLIWGLAWLAVAALSNAIVETHPVVHVDNLLMAMRVIPLLLLLAPLDTGSDNKRILWLDWMQAALATAMMAVFFFPVILSPDLSRDVAASFSYRNAVNIVLIILSFFTLIAFWSSDERRPAIAVSIAVISYALVALYINFFVIRLGAFNPLARQPYVLLDLPFCLFQVLIGIVRDRPATRSRKSFDARNFGPAFIATSVVVSAVAIAKVNVVVGIIVATCAVGVYGIRSTWVLLLFRAQQEGLVAAAAARADYLANISHEIRAPLGSIALSASALARRGQLEEADTTLVRNIRRNSETVIDLLQDMLDLSRLDAKIISITKSAVDLGQVVRRALEHVELYAESCGVNLRHTAPKNDCEIVTDPKRLQQILTNLLLNGIRHTAAGGVVSVDYEPHGKNAIRIMVTDTGVGIPPDQIARIFKRYEQGPPALHGRVGTGLGLPISAELIALLGGTIGVTSKVGVGSCFWVDLPQ